MHVQGGGEQTMDSVSQWLESLVTEMPLGPPAQHRIRGSSPAGWGSSPGISSWPRRACAFLSPCLPCTVSHSWHRRLLAPQSPTVSPRSPSGPPHSGGKVCCQLPLLGTPPDRCLIPLTPAPDQADFQDWETHILSLFLSEPCSGFQLQTLETACG